MPELTAREEVFLSFYKDGVLVAVENVDGHYGVRKQGWKDRVSLFNADKPEKITEKV